MVAVVKARYPGVIAVHCQQVLDQVVAAHGEKVDPLGQGIELVERGRHLHHDPDLGALRDNALLVQLANGAFQQTQRIVNLIKVGHHRQQELHVVAAYRGPQHGTQLHHQYLGVVQGHANAAPAKEGVGFLDGKIGQVLVTADIQGTHHHRQRGKALQLVTIEPRLLLFTRKLLGNHEGHFGTVEPHTADTLLERDRGINGQPGVDHQRHGMTVDGFAGQILLMFKQFEQRLLLGDHALITGPEFFGGAYEQAATMAVEHDFGARETRQRQIHHAEHRGYPHGTGDNRDVGSAGAAYRHQPRQALPGDFGKAGDTDFVADQDGALGKAGGQLGALLLQVHQYTPPQVANVGGALAQVVVIDPLQVLHVAAHHIGQRAGGPLPFADAVFHFLGECRLTEHLLVDLEQRQFLRRDTTGQALAGRPDLLTYVRD